MRSSFQLVTIGVVWATVLLFHGSDAFQTQCLSSLPRPSRTPTLSGQRTTCAIHLSSTPLWSSPADGADSNKKTTLRDRLRKATGFSLTVFRATIRGITGISLTAIYASTLAATGLWIRKVTSVVLSLFPSWFRYFLQPFLVLYYAPLFLLRNLAGSATRQRARQQHATVLEAWKEAVEYAEKMQQDGYWPVVVSEDGYFEMLAPPNPEDTTPAEAKQQFSRAMAETVEHAMEVNDAERGNSNNNNSKKTP
jgi:hypothetical protein